MLRVEVESGMERVGTVDEVEYIVSREKRKHILLENYISGNENLPRSKLKKLITLCGRWIIEQGIGFCSRMEFISMHRNSGSIT